MINFGINWSPQILPFSLVGFWALVAASTLHKRVEPRIRRWIITMLIASAIWAIARMLESFVSPLPMKIILDNLKWFGIAILPPAFLLFSFELSNRNKNYDRIIIFLLVLVPAFTITMIFTNASHQLVYASSTLVQVNGSSILNREFSLLFWIFVNYNSLLVSFAVINLIGYTIHPKGILRLKGLIVQILSIRKNSRTSMLVSRDEYRGLFENAHDAIIISDVESGRILKANVRASEMFGYTSDEFKELKLKDIVSDKNKLSQILKDIGKSKDHNIFELLQFQKNDRTPISTEVTAGIVLFNGKPAVQSIYRDVTLRKNMESQLLHASMHDSLTNLPNRALLLDRLEQAIAHGSRNNKYPFALLYLDLDRFKNINDTLGHMVGDKLLKGIANRIKTVLRESDTVARIGGDEFAIILQDVNSVDILENLCSRILSNINQPIEVDCNEISISASIGVVLGNPMYQNPEEYLKDADIAMFRAKEHGKAKYEIFDISMRNSVFDRMKIELLLCKACYDDEFSVVYQPIFDLEKNDLSSFEALLRWRQPKVGLISPEEFIPIAENLGIINNIGTWVLQKVCAQLRTWEPYIKLIPEFRMNVNISAVQLLRNDFPDELQTILSHENVDPRSLALEITETAFINNPTLASEQVKKIKSIGVNIQLDDFGTGYSSLSFINLFQVDALKIERKFIGSLEKDRQAELVRAIIALGENLNVEVIAEGIENQDQLNFLLNGGCKFGQGFYFSKAVIARDAQKLLSAFVGNLDIQNKLIFAQST